MPTGISSDWRPKLRQEEATPILPEIKTWVDAQSGLPRGNFGKAVNYLKGH
jgi:hypothetical protein